MRKGEKWGNRESERGKEEEDGGGRGNGRGQEEVNGEIEKGHRDRKRWVGGRERGTVTWEDKVRRCAREREIGRQVG